MSAVATIGAVAEALKKPFDIIDQFVPDKDKAAEFKATFSTLVENALHEQLLAQVDLNKAEATSSNIFVAGWRPFIGWVGGFALAWAVFLQPMLAWVFGLAGYTGPLPVLDTGALIALVTSMLGVGAMRSFDKMQGTDTDKITWNGPRKGAK